MKGKEVMRLLGCSRFSLSQYKRRGRIRAIRLGSGRYDYSEEDIRKLMEERKTLDTDRAHRLVCALGYDLKALRSEDRTRLLADRRRIIATLLHRKGHSTPDIARFLHRAPCSVNMMLRTAYLVEKHLPEAERVWDGLG